MGAFLSIGRGAFFAPRGGECCDGLEARSRPSISWSARDVGERSLVKAEAAGGGGRRPAFTRVRSPTWRDVGERSLVKTEAAGTAGGGGRRPAFTRVRSPTSRADQEIEGRERASSQSQHSPPRGAKKAPRPIDKKAPIRANPYKGWPSAPASGGFGLDKAPLTDISR